jgi:hypothetical protein
MTTTSVTSQAAGILDHAGLQHCIVSPVREAGPPRAAVTWHGTGAPAAAEVARLRCALTLAGAGWRVEPVIGRDGCCYLAVQPPAT